MKAKSRKVASANWPFATEADLVASFVDALSLGATCWGRVQLATEWWHPSGAVDVLVRTERRGLIAFEAKLSNWRVALHQAYRNTSYADRAYVLLPDSKIHLPLRNRQEFERRGIGLCAISGDGARVRVHIAASRQSALLAWARKEAHSYFNEK